MTTYTTIPDTDIDSDKPIKSSTAYALRDNLLAVIEGDATAPKITSRTISPGGSRADGECTNATTFPGPGFFDFESLVISSTKSIPFISYIRVDGDATLSSVLTCRRPTHGTTSLAEQQATIALFGGLAGTNGTQVTDVVGGGGGAVGAGGDGTSGATGGTSATTSASLSDSVRAAFLRRVLVGGNSHESGSAQTAVGGGFTCLIVNGDLDATGGTIDCSGNDGTGFSGSDGIGGGGGGCILVFCTGTLTGGTFDASGGDGRDDGSDDGGGGGGGVVGLFASAFAGTQTITVAGGAGPGSATDGAAGLSLGSTTLTVAEINALLLGV